MGIYDREYYRDDAGGWWNTITYRGTVTLIAVTVACFFAAVATRGPDGGPGSFVEAVQFDPRAILSGQVWRVVTSFLAVSSYSLVGLIFAALGLYWFGSEVETVYGTRRFVTFYLAAGLLASGAKLLLHVFGIGPEMVTLGPAAPLFATLVLFACHFPHTHIRIFFVLPIPAWVLVAVALGLYLFSLSVGGPNPSLAEPLTGAGFAFAYHRTAGRLLGFADGLFARRRAAPRLSVYDEPDTPYRPAPSSAREREGDAVSAGVPAPRAAGVDEYLEAKLDAVLEKVAKHGKGSLTADENDVLLRASEAFKRRRG